MYFSVEQDEGVCWRNRSGVNSLESRDKLWRHTMAARYMLGVWQESKDRPFVIKFLVTKLWVPCNGYWRQHMLLGVVLNRLVDVSQSLKNVLNIRSWDWTCDRKSPQRRFRKTWGGNFASWRLRVSKKLPYFWFVPTPRHNRKFISPFLCVPCYCCPLILFSLLRPPQTQQKNCHVVHGWHTCTRMREKIMKIETYFELIRRISPTCFPWECK